MRRFCRTMNSCRNSAVPGSRWCGRASSSSATTARAPSIRAILCRRHEGARATTPVWGRNGSYVVFRRLRQDVKAFREFMEREAARLRGLPAFAGMTATSLAAKLMGRWPSGAPLMRAPQQDDPASRQTHKQTTISCMPTTRRRRCRSRRSSTIPATHLRSRSPIPTDDGALSPRTSAR